MHTPRPGRWDRRAAPLGSATMSTTDASLELLERRPAADGNRVPLLFVHGLGHGAWCWEQWMDAAAEAGHPAYAVSLRGHGGSPGRLRTALLSQYVDDVVRTASGLDRKSTRLNSSHLVISYAVFCLTKKAE